MVDLELLYFLFKIAIIVILVFGFAYLIALAAIVHDYSIIVNKPFLFAIETMLMSLLPGIPILFFVVTRNITWKKAWVWFASLSIKFAIFHVLSQLSGLYNWLFM